MSNKPSAQRRYSRLKALGEERVLAINNLLMRGTSPGRVARMMQQEWKEFTDVAERTLTQQLIRYRDELEPNVRHGVSNVVQLPLTNGLENLVVDGRINIVQEYGQLLAIQKMRIKIGFEREQQAKMLVGMVNKEIETLMSLLEKGQKLQFDLGLDEFKGPMQLPNRGGIGVAVTTTPDGTRTTVVSGELADAAQNVLEEFGLDVVQRRDNSAIDVEDVVERDDTDRRPTD